MEGGKMTARGYSAQPAVADPPHKEKVGKGWEKDVQAGTHVGLLMTHQQHHDKNTNTR